MFSDYPVPPCFDELLTKAHESRFPTVSLALTNLGYDEIIERQLVTDERLRDLGITFAVYGHQDGNEKVWPFDLLPRVVGHEEWQHIDRGLRQRIFALNLFVDDIYNEQKILNDGIIPREMIQTAATFRKECVGHRPPKGVWTHITGTDLIRHEDGEIYVLEDNLRCPSGVSYVLENREVMKRVLPEVFNGQSVASVEDYPERLLDTLLATAPDGVDMPVAVLLTPGIFNSAYFEHSFLAQQMGIELVQGPDLVVIDTYVYTKTIRGLRKVDVIYRRIDDTFLDPLTFRDDSVIGVAGLMEAHRLGHVTLANAPGTGVADDKAIYAYVPEIIKYYTGEDPILQNVPTYVCSDPKQREHVLKNLESLVVKPTNEAGGYGIVLGPRASKKELEECRAQIKADPRNYIAQPMLQLSTVPTMCPDGVEPRHVDLRPFVLLGGLDAADMYVLPGGLTRVALVKNSMIVNSSQGGGSKDTWVLG
ncbi:circularly permuted type 2 ATP-grasp protein [Rubinisphaera margarita]|uniref:circularly permuted type 2 ATP-grasp protein n=1 Tax=Rubinisphaera margarita TaxID=2909586 RepID=UPI001EE828A1|nr:circularly permuted type 2 ATP-grasp protein [Rubinisphaera margarita]MCG6156073.1 circularly permuted type 2 ATP-grasp protein [Rubinisphaera margarita]